MREAHSLRHILLIAAFLTPFATQNASLFAQGITTAAIGGSVHAADGADVDGTEIFVTNTANGYLAQDEVRDGRFLISGLEVGGPYTVTAQFFGYHPQQTEGLVLELGATLRVDFEMQPEAIPLDTLRVVVPPALWPADDHGGTATTIPDSLLHRLPTLNRDFYDFIRLVPQISTKVGAGPGFSGGGTGFRFNNFLINGVSERSLANHLTRAILGGKSLPLDAVKEYQVLVAPYHARFGDFSGALVNTVTNSGTNEVTGSGFAYWLSDRLARQLDEDPGMPYDEVQYGFSLGGPILRDRLHYYVALERQHFTSPAPGPYRGQPSSVDPPLPLREADLARFDEIMHGYGLATGSAGAVENENPVTSIFARMDLNVPSWNSRAVLWGLYGRNAVSDLYRDWNDFPLSIYQFEQRGEPSHLAFQLHTSLGQNSGGHNELLVSHRSVQVDGISVVDQPVVNVSFPETDAGPVTVRTGTNEAAHGVSARNWSFNVQDHVTLSLGANHVMTFGATVEGFRDVREGLPGSYGTWSFSSLDSLALGIAERFELPQNFGSASIPISGAQYGFYVGDRWQVGERIAVRVGIRADALTIDERAPYNPVVDSIFQRRTDEMPGTQVEWSPRFGFVWDVSGTGVDRIRGGTGIFTGRAPVHWYRAALIRFGIRGAGVLRCGTQPFDLGLPPLFEPDYRSAPTTCENGSGLSQAPSGFDVDLLSRDLSMGRTLRASLAYDRGLPGGIVATAEALFTRSLSDFVFVNLNLVGPQGTDRNGRVLYGTIGEDGFSTPALRSDFSEVIELTNTSRNHAFQFSTSMEKRFASGLGAMASYTYSRVRDVQTPVEAGGPGFPNWSSRAISGRHDDLTPEVSLNDIPHRVIFAGTYEAPWESWRTIFSFEYVGESGGPFTYLAWGGDGRGDLNADGSGGNDPIYVPRDAFDPNEIAFSGFSDHPDDDNSPEVQAIRMREQQEAFERFIDHVPCLRSQRGRMLERNSCRAPWSHFTSLSVRQTIPVAGRSLEAAFNVFNLLNLLNSGWGHYRTSDPALLEHVGQTSGDPETAQPIFRFFEDRPEWATLPSESVYQLQLALRYSF